MEACGVCLTSYQGIRQLPCLIYGFSYPLPQINFKSFIFFEVLLTVDNSNCLETRTALVVRNNNILLSLCHKHLTLVILLYTISKFSFLFNITFFIWVLYIAVLFMPIENSIMFKCLLYYSINQVVLNIFRKSNEPW